MRRISQHFTEFTAALTNTSARACASVFSLGDASLRNVELLTRAPHFLSCRPLFPSPRRCAPQPWLCRREAGGAREQRRRPGPAPASPGSGRGPR